MIVNKYILVIGKQYNLNMHTVERSRSPVSTEEIRVGLQRIKKAQEEVLKQLRKDQAEEYGESNIFKIKTNEILTLKKQMRHLEQRSREHNRLYERRVQDLQMSLRQKEKEMSSMQGVLEQKVVLLQRQRKLLQVQMSSIREQGRECRQGQQLRVQYGKVKEIKEALMKEKIHLLKVNSKLQSQNIQLKQKLTQLDIKYHNSISNSNSNSNKVKDNGNDGYGYGNSKPLIEQISRLNRIHEGMVTRLRKDNRYGRQQLCDQQEYQNSLNRIVSGLSQHTHNHTQFPFAQTQSHTQQRVQQLKGQLEKERGQKQFYINQLQQIKTMMVKIKEHERSAAEWQQKQHRYEQLIGELNEQMRRIVRQKDSMMDTINKINNHNTKSNSHSEQSSQVLIGRLNNRIGDLQAQLIVCREECSELKQRTNEYVVEVEHIHKDKAKAKNKIQQMYNELQTLIRQKQRMLQENRGYRAQTQEMQKQISKLSNEVEQVREGSKRKQMMNGKQMEQRVRQIGQLRSYNEKMLKERREVKELRVANERLEKEKEFINRQTKQLNNKVDHLWSIKEVEYQNINQIVHQLKQN